MRRILWAAIVIGLILIVVSLLKVRAERIGIVEIEGVITDSKEVLEQIEKFKDDVTVKGIVVRINSPGGASAPCQEIFRELRKLSEKKKVFVSMGSVCASGGYYIACAGEKIYAMPSTVTGSIGVLVETIVLEDLLRKLGLQSVIIKSGEYKDTGSPLRKMKEEEKAYIKEIVDSIHEQFIEDVANGRKLPKEKVKKLSDGRVFLGTSAKEYGLVDKIGTLNDAIEDLRLTLGLKERPEIVYAKRKLDILRLLISYILEEKSRIYGIRLPT